MKEFIKEPTGVFIGGVIAAVLIIGIRRGSLFIIGTAVLTTIICVLITVKAPWHYCCDSCHRQGSKDCQHRDRKKRIHLF